MEHIFPPANPLSLPRVWYPVPFSDRKARSYLISFRIAEEATWDHRFHDLDGRELGDGELALSSADYRFIQASCDRAVGASRVTLSMPAANASNGAYALALAGSV